MNSTLLLPIIVCTLSTIQQFSIYYIKWAGRIFFLERISKNACLLEFWVRKFTKVPKQNDFGCALKFFAAYAPLLFPYLALCFRALIKASHLLRVKEERNSKVKVSGRWQKAQVIWQIKATLPILRKYPGVNWILIETREED